MPAYEYEIEFFLIDQILVHIPFENFLLMLNMWRRHIAFWQQYITLLSVVF